MKLRLLGLMLLVGCLGGRAREPAPAAAGDSARATEEAPEVCQRVADVTVYVDNRSSFSIQISFGSYTPAREVLGLTRTTYRVPRYYLEGDIRLKIVGGGIELGAAPLIPTEPVACNDATLIIGPRPRYSFFYGELVRLSEPHHTDVPDSVPMRPFHPAP